MATNNKFRTYPIVGSLKAQYPAFRFVDPQGTYESPGGTVTLTASTTQYVVFTRATGVVTTTTTANNPAYVYGDQFITDATSIVEVVPTIQTPVLGGQTGGVAVPAGLVGQVLSSLVPLGSAVSLTTATPANVTSLTLTAGDWDVWGNLNLSAGAASVTVLSGGLSTTTGTLPTDGTECFSGQQSTTTTFKGTISVPSKPVNVSSSTPVYLVASATFSAGTVAGYGAMYARRRS
jgi:hypothetical protein